MSNTAVIEPHLVPEFSVDDIAASDKIFFGPEERWYRVGPMNHGAG
jgi:hypothetical protein